MVTMVLIYIFLYKYIFYSYYCFNPFALTRKLLNLFKGVFVTVLDNFQSLIFQPQQYQQENSYFIA